MELIRQMELYFPLRDAELKPMSGFFLFYITDECILYLFFIPLHSVNTDLLSIFYLVHQS